MKTTPLIFSILIITVYSQCPAGCLNCETSTTCVECIENFLLIDSTFCVPCPLGCLSCSLGPDNKPVCDLCNPPANLDQNGRCFLCDPSCLTCMDKPKNCISCREGKELSIEGKCQSIGGCPIQNCLGCAITDDPNHIQCETCSNGFFSYNQNCYPCKYPCSQCTFDKNQLWASVIEPTWIQILQNSYNFTETNASAGVLQSITNNLDFGSMSQTLKRGWTQAFFVMNLISSSVTNPELFMASIPDHIDFYVENQNKSQSQLQLLILNRVNSIVGKNWTMADYVKKIGQIASNFTNCTICSVGFTLFASGNNIICQRCPIGCAQCSGGVCLTCRNGTFLSSGNCVQCTSPCANCENSSTTCTSCKLPASLSGNTCVVCADPCATCLSSNTSVCLTCKQSYSLIPDSSGSCFKCNQDLCVECDRNNNSICYLCKPGATLINGRCQICPGSCSSCVFNGVSSLCFGCLRGFQLVYTDIGRCVPCGPGCVSCSAGACQQCLPGSFLNLQNATCMKCKVGCKECSSYETCLVYENGIFIIDDKVVACRPGCKACDSPQICIQCQQKYFLVSNVCRPCEQGCQQCSSSAICTKCFDDLHLSNGDCLACSGACRTCNRANLTQCLTCKRGYTLIGVQCLHQCNRGCLECDAFNSTICRICEQGYSLRSDGRCVQCPGTCSGICDPRNISVCLGCVDGFELKSNQCIRCPAGCTTCLNGQCSTCAPGFKLKQSLSGSFLCLQNCKSPCKTCYNDTCSECELGFLLINGRCTPDLSCNPICQFCPISTEKNSNGACISCPQNCSTCLSGVCLQCLPGLYLNSILICVSCPEKCKTCYNQNSCDECSAGYVKQISTMTSTISDASFSDQCIACDTNCKTCIVQPERCTSCIDGMMLKSYRCAGLFTVVYQYQLDNNYLDFLENSQTDYFLEAVSNMIGVNITDNYINYIRQGSTIVGGTISTQSQSQAISIQSSLSSSPPGYTVLSSSSTIYYQDMPYIQKKQEQNPQPQPETNIGIIIGASVGGLIVIISIILIIYKLRTRKLVAQVIEIGKQQLSDSQFKY